MPALAGHDPLVSLHGCSTAGELEGTRVHDDTVVATAWWFERGRAEAARRTLAEAPDGEGLGQRMAGLVPHAGQVASSTVWLSAFYGVEVGIGTLGGGDTFGPQRKVTRSKGSLSASGLRFPLVGHTALESEVGVGTTFILRLPASQKRGA